MTDLFFTIASAVAIVVHLAAVIVFFGLLATKDRPAIPEIRGPY